MVAIKEQQNINVLKYIIEKGADLNIQKNQGDTVLHISTTVFFFFLKIFKTIFFFFLIILYLAVGVILGRADVVKLILEYGPKTDMFILFFMY